MALNLRLLQFNLPLIFKSTLRNNLSGTVYFRINRSIFTDKTIGMNNYEYIRSQMRQQFTNVEASFRTKMQEIVNNEVSVVFTEDLKAMSHLVTDNADDLDLFVKMIYKFNSQNKELRFGNYVFGPVIMRAFNYVNRPDLALSTFLDPNLTSFFNQSMSYTVLMTSLYNHKMYSEVRKVFDIYKKNSLNNERFPRLPTIATAAACYQENTPESYNYLLQSWKELSEYNFPPLRKLITFLAALALKQNSPEITLELMSLIRARHIHSRCLRILAYSKLNRYNDVAYILKNSLEGNYKTQERYFSDVIQKLEEDLENNDDDIKPTLTKLISLLKVQEHIETETLESHLVRPIEFIYKRANLDQQKDVFKKTQQRRIIGLKDLI
ncbi:pentatricopeptide repeat-containing protein 2, mitochondrial-like [Vespa crabro]|uniref:pentatricopeptide repeat-containing protein 2, mitochondrial-like n=1 Tax=Vespa crabro TaxID=7445 RepID=UPI001F028392|nr:pentatricopeptide repeat-containing protein 2, mitochondrial-like [Vespa crabro]